MIRKTNLSDQSEVRTKVLAGVTKMAELVGMTLGPCGQSVLIERGAGEPLIVDDGRRVAENIKLDDPIEHMAARVCYSVTRKTDEKVGDGTTTSMVLAHGILKDIITNHISFGFGTNTNVSEIDSRIQRSKDEVISLLDKKARQIKTEADLKDVAAISAGDKKLGDIIGGMYWQMGKDGHIALEFNLLTEEIETEIARGYRFTGGYAAPWMINNLLRKVWAMADVDILIANQKITDIKDLEPIANTVANKGKSHLVIIAKSFAPSVLKVAYQNGTRQKNPFLLMCVRAPGRGEEAYKDMAIFTGGKYFSENDDLKLATAQDLGYARSIEVSEDTCILIDGKGKKEDIEKRIKEVEEGDLKKQKLHQFKQDRLERMSALNGSVGVIRIGAPTDEERNWLKYKIEDAKHATKQAFKHGIVKGGGLTYKEISEELSDGNILKTALLAPYEKLKANAGGTLKVGKDVIDPVAVEKAALEHACSAVSKLIRIGGAIAMLPPPTLDEAMKAISGNAEQTDDLVQDDYEE
jgi:chaperonin GroEL